jgi:hypothetical protein
MEGIKGGLMSPAMRRIPYLALALAALCLGDAHAAETDQYLAWGVELEDSSDAINGFLNGELECFLLDLNEADAMPHEPEELTRQFYVHLFKGLLASRFRNWLHHSSEVDRYPDSSVSFYRYERMSIYRGRTFPFFLPMSRTIRVGDVYCGTDKFGHFFGFGRRYFNKYLRLRARGRTDEEAMERIVRSGLRREHIAVGGLVDGIVSYADIEAGFQGFLLARDLCGGDDPFVKHLDGKWTMVRPVDIRHYITADFDESFNPPHYQALRKRFVLPLLEREYGGKINLPAVQERFARYRLHRPSFCHQTIQARLETKKKNPQRLQHLQAFGVEPGCMYYGSDTSSEAAARPEAPSTPRGRRAN